jgi:hypothetical protein
MFPDSVRSTEEVCCAVMLKRTGGRLFVDGHSADGIDRSPACERCAYTVGHVHFLSPENALRTYLID